MRGVVSPEGMSGYEICKDGQKKEGEGQWGKKKCPLKNFHNKGGNVLGENGK